MSVVDESSKLGRYTLLCSGLLTTTVITVLHLGIEEIHIHKKVLREPAPLDDRDSFSSSMLKAVFTSFPPELCDTPNSFFSKLHIGNASGTIVVDHTYKRPSNLSRGQQEAYQRCEQDQTDSIVKSCFFCCTICGG